MITGYCVKCKEKGVHLSDPVIHQTKKGGYMAKGACPVCSTTVCSIMSKDKANQAISSGVRQAD